MAKKYLRLSSVLKKLLFDRDMKPVDLARALYMPTPTIHRLVTGKSTRPHESSLKPIANYFSIEVGQLLGEEPLPQWENNQQAAALPNMIKTIPIIGWEEIADLQKAIQLSQKKIPVAGEVNDDCFALIMNDHSMEPLFPKKTILIFDPHKKPVDRSYVLVKLDGKSNPIFRTLLIDADYKYLKPLNPDLNMYKMRLLEDKHLIVACLFESRLNHTPDESNNFLEVAS